MYVCVCAHMHMCVYAWSVWVLHIHVHVHMYNEALLDDQFLIWDYYQSCVFFHSILIILCMVEYSLYASGELQWSVTAFTVS